MTTTKETNRYRLSSYLRRMQKYTTADPLFFTKRFLIYHNISVKKFFQWIVEDSARFNYTINSDKDVMKYLQ